MKSGIITLRTTELEQPVAKESARRAAQSAPSRPARAKAARSPRILYAAGNGDVIGTYRHWKTQADDPSQLSMTYSGQFFDLCRRMGCRGYVLVRDGRRGHERDEQFVIDQRRPARFVNGPGALYHVEQFLASLRVMRLSLRHRADVVVAASGSGHWFPLAALRLMGVKVVPALHCVLWPKYRPPGRIRRMVNALDGLFFKRAASAILTASHDIDDQLAEMVGPQSAGQLSLVPFLPTYRAECFPPVAPPPAAPPFRVLYAGRVEPEKGVFDLLDMARKLAAAGHAHIEFDVCGSGSALDELKRRTAGAGLSSRIRFHGHCERPVMVRMFQRSHAVVVPTTTEFVEGFNQVVVEGILSGRPVVTSSVCPAVRYVGEAVVAVPPDDVAAYSRAILRLADDREFYGRCHAQCQQVKNQFFDAQRGWGAALESALTQILDLQTGPQGQPA